MSETDKISCEIDKVMFNYGRDVCNNLINDLIQSARKVRISDGELLDFNENSWNYIVISRDKLEGALPELK